MGARRNQPECSVSTPKSDCQTAEKMSHSLRGAGGVGPQSKGVSNSPDRGICLWRPTTQNLNNHRHNDYRKSDKKMLHTHKPTPAAGRLAESLRRTHTCTPTWCHSSLRQSQLLWWRYLSQTHPGLLGDHDPSLEGGCRPDGNWQSTPIRCWRQGSSSTVCPNIL